MFEFLANKDSKWLVKQTWDLGPGHFDNKNNNYCVLIFLVEANNKEEAKKKTAESKAEITLLTDEVPSMDECAKLLEEKLLSNKEGK